MHETTDAKIQIHYARIAGFAYLLLIVLFMGSQVSQAAITSLVLIRP